MDYKKLADLLYPNIKTSAQEYEKLYPKRELSKGAEVTRFAPSPTGLMHIGNFYQCLVDSRVAESTGGVFYLRLEDTDKKRELEGAGEVVVKVINEYGINIMEGLMPDGKQIGKYGPYIQSERLDIYHAFAYELVKKGRAFPCFCEKAENKQEIELRREEALVSSGELSETDVCRELSFEQIEQNILAGKPWALRLRAIHSADDKIEVEDAILGKRIIPANTYDIVLIKSNAIPVYAFAHAIDDHLMRTTLVVRGGEWFPSVASHIDLFEALGFDKVRYAHTGLISKLDNGNKRKLSKRKDAEADMRYFIRDGYPKQAVIEYLLNIANSNFEQWRKANPKADNKDFDFKIQKLNVSDPIFDIVKLQDISKNIISVMSTDEVFEMLKEWASVYAQDFYEIIIQRPDFIKGMLSIDRGGDKPRKDISQMSKVKEYFDYMFDDKYTRNFDAKFNKEDIKMAIKSYLKHYKHSGTKDEWFPTLKEACVDAGFCADMKLYKQDPSAFVGNVAEFSNIIRVAITGKSNTPDLYSIMQLLGEKEVKTRLENSII